MTALPQIFATQPSTTPPLSRNAVSDESLPGVTDKVQAQGRGQGSGKSNAQSTDRNFDDAMSEQKTAQTQREETNLHTERSNPSAKDANDGPEALHTQKQVTDPSGETSSEMIFGSLLNASADTPDTAQDRVAGETDENSAASNTALGTAAVPVAESGAEITSEQTALAEADRLLRSPEGDGDNDEARLARPAASLNDVEQGQKNPANLIARDGAALPDDGRANDVVVTPDDATRQTSVATTEEVKAGPALRAEPNADQKATGSGDEARNTDIQSVASDRHPSVADTPEQIEGQSRTLAQNDQDLAATATNPRETTLQASSESEGRAARSEVANNDASLKADRDADLPVRSDRSYAAPSAADMLPDADRLMPVTTKPVSLTALADSVSLPGMSSALPASTPLTPISGLSERLAASILQTTNANPTVTLDKIPQTIVSVALSSRSATIQIDPPELGRIQLDYQFDSQGRTVVTLTPESEAARAALVDRMATITAALEQGSSAGVDVKLGDTKDFGTAFSDASNGNSSDEDPSSASLTSDDPLPSPAQDHQPLAGHHIAEDGTARLHMRV